MIVAVKINNRTFEVEVGDLHARPILATIAGETFEVFPVEQKDVAKTFSTVWTPPSNECNHSRPDSRGYHSRFYDHGDRMHHIYYKKQLSETVFLMRVEAPHIARERAAGQFIILQLDDDFGERIPLTIADANIDEVSITIIFQVVGKTTMALSKMEVGDTIPTVVGPLGQPTHIEHFGAVIGVGGGIGVAPLHPIAQALKKAGNHLTLILGARTKNLLILEDEMRAIADELIICTDDGSYGRKALVTGPLQELCATEPKPNLVVAIGPPIMMKFCAETTRPFAVPTLVSLNTIMVDGTGMCGGCRVSVGKTAKFVCVDGPEFDGHQVDFDNMMVRLNSYRRIEQQAFHQCKLEPEVQRQGARQ